MDCHNFLASMTNIINLQHSITAACWMQAAWFLTMPMAGQLRAADDNLEDLIDVTFGAKMLVHFQIRNQTFLTLI